MHDKPGTVARGICALTHRFGDKPQARAALLLRPLPLDASVAQRTFQTKNAAPWDGVSYCLGP
ncbi:MAG: hypothetical protein N2B03_03290 [Boseongicola sp.]